MGFGVKNNNNKDDNNNNSNKEREFFDIYAHSPEVTRVRVFSDTAIGFTLRCKGVSFYNLVLREMKDGSVVIFPPSTKSGNNYYPQYGLYLSPEDTAKIQAEVLRIANSK